MLLPVTTSILMGGLVGYSLLQQGGRTSDAAKISRICSNAGLVVKEGKSTRTMQLMRRKRHNWGYEYVYRIPLGLSLKDYENHLDVIQDGLNNKYIPYELTLADLKELKFDKTIIEQVKKLLSRKKKVQKEVELEYDGMLKIRVYTESLTNYLLYDDELYCQCAGWEVPVGISRKEFVKHNFEKMAHIIVAGTTDSGKSVFLKNIITTLIKQKPDDVIFSLIDLKGGLTFARYKDCKQVQSVTKDVEGALEALRVIQSQLNEKMQYLESRGYEDIKEAGYTERHFIIVDEAAEISSAGEPDNQTKKLKIECENIVTDIARRGRACGYRLIYATQYPTNETLKSQVRQNISARVCYPLKTAAASRAVLDEEGAEKLPFIQGRAIYSAKENHIVQTPLIENKYIEKAIKPHIVIKPRTEEDESSHAKGSSEDSTPGTNTLVLEET